MEFFICSFYSFKTPGYYLFADSERLYWVFYRTKNSNNPFLLSLDCTVEPLTVTLVRYK